MASKQQVKSRKSQPAPTPPAAGAKSLGETTASGLSRLFIPVDITPLVYFRILFGVMMLWLGWQYFHGRDVISGRTYNLIKYHYIDPRFHFTYPGFDWVKPWPGDGMYIHCYILGFAAVLIAVGLFYRLAAATFCLGFTYIFLLDQARYLHHYYLICLVSMLLVFLPANRKFSVDALFRPKLRSSTTPIWTIWLMRLQLGVVYFYAGVAKCTYDWLHGEPVRTMLAYKQHRFPNASFLTRFFSDEWFVGLVAYGGLVFDLVVFPLLLFRKTRWIALAGMILFHLANTQLFDIDIFPWFMLGATLIFFFPDWLPFRSAKQSDANIDEASQSQPASRLTSWQKTTATLVIAYALAQLLIPLRPFFYPGDANWTDEGRHFSWRMLSRDLRAAAHPRFSVSYRKDGRTIQSQFPFPKDMRFWQSDPQFSKMIKNPDMLLYFVHLQRDEMRRNGAEDIDVRVDLKLSLNGRKPQDFVDTTVNLADEPRRVLTHYPWIVPLTEPLPERRSSSEDSPTGAGQEDVPSIDAFDSN